ncbi:hypothetical protein ACU4GD_09340 [Cupriavidus basilensis]
MRLALALALVPAVHTPVVVGLMHLPGPPATSTAMPAIEAILLPRRAAGRESAVASGNCCAEAARRAAAGGSARTRPGRIAPGIPPRRLPPRRRRRRRLRSGSGQAMASAGGQAGQGAASAPAAADVRACRRTASAIRRRRPGCCTTPASSTAYRIRMASSAGSRTVRAICLRWETRVLWFRFNFHSSGALSERGPAPERYEEEPPQPQRGGPLDRAAGALVFEGRNKQVPLPAAGQDRFSVFLQLVGLVRGNPQRATPRPASPKPSRWRIRVTWSRCRCSMWEREDVDTGRGAVHAKHFAAPAAACGRSPAGGGVAGASRCGGCR